MSWMRQMKLKLNPEKTEFLVFGNQIQVSKCDIKQFKAGDDIIECQQSARILGAHLDTSLTFKLHCEKQAKKAMINYVNIRNIRKYLNKGMCETLVLSLVITHLDYCNSILYGVPDITIKKLQRVQNLCAKLILNKTKYDSNTDCLKELHWLPVVYRIKFKIVTIMHKCIHGVAPQYLKDLVTFKQPASRSLRSNTQQLQCIIPRTKFKTFKARSFSVAGPTLWNEVPLNIRTLTSYETFKIKLKSYYFQCIFT